MLLNKALEGFILYLSSCDYAPITARNYAHFMRLIVQYLGEKELSDVTTNDLRQFLVAYRDKGRAGSSVAQYWKTIRVFYNFVEQELHLPRPDLAIKQPRYTTRQIVSLSKDEVKKLLAACQCIKNKAILLVLLDTGMRVGELTRLIIGNVTLTSGMVQILPYLSGLKSRGRTVYLSKSTRSILWQYLASRPGVAQEAPLFANRRGVALNCHDIANILARLGRATGIAHVRPHRWRHTFAIEYLRNGGDVFTLQQLLGHSDLSMVKRYLSIAQVDVEAAHRKASPVERWGL